MSGGRWKRKLGQQLSWNNYIFYPCTHVSLSPLWPRFLMKLHQPHNKRIFMLLETVNYLKLARLADDTVRSYCLAKASISARYICLCPVLTGGAAAWWIAGNDARKAQTSKVQSKFVVIIFANQFGVHLGNAVNGARPLNLQNERERQRGGRDLNLNIEQTAGKERES